MKRALADLLAARRPPPRGRNHYLLVILDSCRLDSFVEARPVHMARLGEVQRRFSYATWTPPAHFNLLMGLLPHPSPRNVFASDYYKRGYREFEQRLGCDEVDFEKMLPHLFLPTYLRHKLGYETHARVSLPVLNPSTPINRDFDTFQLMDRHNDFEAMIDSLRFDADRPSFHLLNLGETHFPYATAEEDPSCWPRIHGPEGVYQDLDPVVQGQVLQQQDAPRLFDAGRLESLRQRQVRAVGAVDRAFEKLLDVVPRNTYITVTADHGELFGEDGYFGHGPIAHPKVLEVPFLEAKVK